MGLILALFYCLKKEAIANLLLKMLLWIGCYKGQVVSLHQIELSVVALNENFGKAEHLCLLLNQTWKHKEDNERTKWKIFWMRTRVTFEPKYIFEKKNKSFDKKEWASYLSCQLLEDECRGNFTS